MEKVVYCNWFLKTRAQHKALFENMPNYIKKIIKFNLNSVLFCQGQIYF